MIRLRLLCALTVWMGMTVSAEATTKGLNQIITPDIQPVGLLSVSFQAESPAIGNQMQLQLELGIAETFEVALFRGLSPGQFIGGVEYGLVQHPSFLLSTGLFAPGPGSGFQPYLVAGFLRPRSEFIVGAIYAERDTEALLGWAYTVNSRLQFIADYQGGGGNFSTAGLTYSLSPTLSLNPAIYVSNRTPRHAYGYAVLTWNVTAWK
jgi:hypothetical protein